jgi:nucleoside-diphosphate-sugar epimerase
MNILITGGAGFIGQRVAMECLQRGNLQIDGKASDAIENIVLTDNAEPPFWHEGLRDDARITTTFGDISDEPYVKSVFDKNYDVIFHLASIVSGHGEQDFDLAMKVNVDGARYLFEAIRAQNNNAKVVFASSIAAFGGDSMPEQLSDFSKQTPLTTYGVTKVIGELLINDYSRKGFFDGRSARLPTVIVRPGKPNLAASSFVSGLFREPLSGEPCVIPVDPSQEMPVLGYRSIVNGIIKLAEIPAEQFGTDRAVGLPAFNTNVQELMDALKNAAGNRHLGEHVMEKDDQIVAICSGWPKKVDTTRAQSLGLPMDDSIEQIVLDYIEDYLDA